jgi:Lon-like ATP-dependent protease
MAKKATSTKRATKKTTTSAKKTSASHTKGLGFKTTADIDVSDKIIEQVIGQDEAVNIIKKAAIQRRHVLLIGEPGTGKSMLGLALAELLPKEKLVDTLSFPNPNDENQPLIRTVSAGQGRELAKPSAPDMSAGFGNQSFFLFILVAASVFLPFYFWQTGKISDVIYAASMITTVIIMVGVVLILNINKRMKTRSSSPKVIVDNYDTDRKVFYDATGSHAGALLGDVLHDPFQSGGLGTPAHERVVAGMIHKAHMGVLFIDEIGTLQGGTQQELLTAIQEKKFSITGQSERSAGAMVRTEPVPCNFILIAAGNIETIQRMHPALRSRIRGYGYEVFMNETMKDTPENRYKVAYFIAQEVKKDEKIPHFTKEAVEDIILDARRMANRKNHLTLRLRDLGGLVRAAGDIALEEEADKVTLAHVKTAKRIARNLEQQIADRFIERKKEYEVIVTKGNHIGRINGLAVIGSGSSFSGIVLPIEAEVTKRGKTQEDIIATGKLGEIAKEAIKNVSAIIKRYFSDDVKDLHDIYVQFLQTYEGVEGDSASIAVATAVISAVTGASIRQDIAVTGSLSVRGDVLPIGGVSAKVEAAVEADVKTVLIPHSNMQDLVLRKEDEKRIDIVPVTNLYDVLDVILVQGKEKTTILKRLKGLKTKN